MQAPEIEGASIVMIGSFNPSIFQPRWLGAQQLIRPEEAETAKVTVIHAELTDFSTEWFQLQVLQNRFTVATADPRQYGPLRDLAMAIFAILPHTPISVVGVNRLFHFKMSSIDAWHGLGHLLAPKEPWHAIMKESGLRSMLMQGRRVEAGGGLLHVKIEPSTKFEHGLYVEVNEEFKPPADLQSEGAQWVPACLAEHWDAFMEFAEKTAEQLLGLVKK